MIVGKAIGAMRDTSAQYYEGHWETLVELSSAEWQTMIRNAAYRVERGRIRYQAAQDLTAVPWQIVGVIHNMEAGGVFSKCLANGQPWNQKTTIEPTGAGPWRSWEDSAVWALRHDGLAGETDWSIGATGKRLERYNGGGYIKRGKNSPYLYSGSQHGVGSGKYVGERPGKKAGYDADAVSQQVGAMVILKRMAATGLYRPGAPAPTVAPEPVKPTLGLAYDPSVENPAVFAIQIGLNALGEYVGGRLAYLRERPLETDCRLGPLTAKAIWIASGRWPAETPQNVRRVIEALAAAMGV